MANDEVRIKIDKAFWPKGVIRGLAPILRSLGDKHGNLVIAAQAAKGEIMLKGPKESIEAALPALKDIVEEHFPEAPLPEELGGAATGEDAVEDAVEEVAEAPAPVRAQPKAPSAKQKPTEKAAGVMGKLAKADTGAGAKAPPAASSGKPRQPVAGRNPLRIYRTASPDLLWECTRKSSSFIRKPNREVKRPFSAEPCNLKAFHCAKYSGIVAAEALDVRAVVQADKESIELVQGHAKVSRHQRPASTLVRTGLKKCPERGLRQIDREIETRYYRKSLHTIAREKYIKVQKSFRKKKVVAKSRRARK